MEKVLFLHQLREVFRLIIAGPLPISSLTLQQSMIWPTPLHVGNWCCLKRRFLPKAAKNIFFFPFQQKIALQFFVEMEKRK